MGTFSCLLYFGRVAIVVLITATFEFNVIETGGLHQRKWRGKVLETTSRDRITYDQCNQLIEKFQQPRVNSIDLLVQRKIKGDKQFLQW